MQTIDEKAIRESGFLDVAKMQDSATKLKAPGYSPEEIYEFFKTNETDYSWKPQATPVPWWAKRVPSFESIASKMPQYIPPDSFPPDMQPIPFGESLEAADRIFSFPGQATPSPTMLPGERAIGGLPQNLVERIQGVAAPAETKAAGPEFDQRMTAPHAPRIINPDGSYSTHKMA